MDPCQSLFEPLKPLSNVGLPNTSLVSPPVLPVLPPLPPLLASTLVFSFPKDLPYLSAMSPSRGALRCISTYSSQPRTLAPLGLTTTRVPTRRPDFPPPTDCLDQSVRSRIRRRRSVHRTCGSADFGARNLVAGCSSVSSWSVRRLNLGVYAVSGHRHTLYTIKRRHSERGAWTCEWPTRTIDSGFHTIFRSSAHVE